ncbi:MAG TPA: GH3 auxin-responsive promoter family protein [candidate division Zixibacteria bacterium]|nr:GH3 auxin-responsive promoter family protein [candidate division Zixibacteria bacterium]
MELLIKAAAIVTGLEWARWERLTRAPQETQDRLLLDIIGRNRATRFGRDHGFDSIRTPGDYRKRVPVGDYERFRPYVERAADHGEPRALTAEPVLSFTLTSGSTGRPKLIPVTRTTRHNHRQLTRLWYYRALMDHPGLFGGKLLGVVSPAVEGHTPAGIPFGAASGLIYESSPLWIQNAAAVPYEVSRIKDFDAKYYVTMRLALEHDVSFLGTPNPSTILKLVETADRHKDELIKDIHDGSIGARWDVPASIRGELLRRLTKNPARASWLEKLAGSDGRLRPSAYWPGLQLIGCWKGGSVAVRLHELERWFDKTTAIRDLGYMASEAQMSLPVSDSGSAGILAIDKNFYEFIPESEIDAARPVTLDCSELEEGQVYYVVLTTAGGLYRYDINDLVRVAGFYNRTPLIEFVRKGRDVTSITGEKLHVNQVIEAMAQAQSAAGIAVRHFRAWADVERSRYAFCVEPVGAAPDTERLSQLLDALDAALQLANIEYREKRASRRLGEPVLCLMKAGWFERRSEAALHRGARDVQFKAPLLSTAAEDPAEIERIVGRAGNAGNEAGRGTEPADPGAGDRKLTHPR